MDRQWESVLEPTLTKLLTISDKSQHVPHRRITIKKTTNMKETIAKINEVMAVLQAELAKAAEGNKAAAARARKATLELEKLGKEFRKQSVAEMK